MLTLHPLCGSPRGTSFRKMDPRYGNTLTIWGAEICTIQLCDRFESTTIPYQASEAKVYTNSIGRLMKLWGLCHSLKKHFKI
jgi:hypothetical protein